MAGTERTTAFILRSVEYGDRDLIVTVFGRSTGLFSAIAKNARGSKRRFGGGLQPMRLLEAVYTAKPNRDLARLEEIDVVEDFAALQTNYDKITLGSYATELVRRVTVEDDPEPLVFDQMRSFYERLAGASDDLIVLEVILRHFELQLLQQLGLVSSLDACMRCGTPAEDLPKVYALRSGEGLVCADCARPSESVGVLYPQTLQLLNYIRRPSGDPPDAFSTPKILEQTRRVIDASVERVVEQPLKSRPMLDTVLAPLSDDDP